MRMPGIIELAILATLTFGALLFGAWYLIRLAQRSLRAREQLVELERERSRAPDES